MSWARTSRFPEPWPTVPIFPNSHSFAGPATALTEPGETQATGTERIADAITPDVVDGISQELWDGRQLVVGSDQRPTCVSRCGEWKEKRIGSTVGQLHTYSAPVLVGVVVKQSPALQHPRVTRAT